MDSKEFFALLKSSHSGDKSSEDKLKKWGDKQAKCLIKICEKTMKTPEVIDAINKSRFSEFDKALLYTAYVSSLSELLNAV